ncbi:MULTISPECIES: hypothetical protein [unclassified Romboutsia]|uniref:hypothetical protein n=1 Tax=unclassified Romboutsia TaxID=2626894 RepID=UPI000822E8E3|nr:MULTISPECIES: hypothetical protein [unclassified Romboutsia]SCI21955.1 Uncharacterised protein [uncultured Clostridium sp.]
MKTNLILSTINQLLEEINKTNILKSKSIKKYTKDLIKVKSKYEVLEIDEKHKTQYNKMNSKGIELLKEMTNSKNKVNDIEKNLEVYIRYLNASLYDFQEKTLYLRKYITSFLFCSILFLALSPQFYGFILPVLFFLPIYMGLKGVKQRSMTGFYMTMSVVPMGIMTAVTWIRYGINAKSNYDEFVQLIVNDGVSIELARNLVWIGPVLGVLLLGFSLLQMYRGFKAKNLFI